jgi:hypothetical protein
MHCVHRPLPQSTQGLAAKPSRGLTLSAISVIGAGNKLRGIWQVPGGLCAVASWGHCELPDSFKLE